MRIEFLNNIMFVQHLYHRQSDFLLSCLKFFTHIEQKTVLLNCYAPSKEIRK